MGAMKAGGYASHRNASWAFVGLHLISRLPESNSIYLGAAHLLGLLIERVQRKSDSLEERTAKAESELRQMKLVRAEDAKANEKVVAIFASHEQSWIAEKKSLRLQIRALSNQLQSLTAKSEETLSNMSYKIAEAECEIKAKDEALVEEIKKTEELLSKLQSAEKEIEGLRELNDNNARLEAEIAATKQELDRVFDMKEEAVLMAERLLDKTERMQVDAEQKDKILSALLRKSKLDATEKQMLLKEVKITKAKKKQAELESEKWRNKWELKNKKGSRSSYSIESGGSQGRREELHNDLEFSETRGESFMAAIKCLDHQCSREDLNDELATHDIQNLQDWVRMETEKYATILEQKHFTEIEAFTEQMRLKDEKLEAFRWRLLSKDIESKRLQSQIEGLEENTSQLREGNFKLQALLMDKEGEIKSVKEQFGLFVHNSWICDPQAVLNPGMSNESKMKHDPEADSAEDASSIENKILDEAVTFSNRSDQVVSDITANSSIGSPLSTDNSLDSSIIGINEMSSEETKSINSYDEHAKNTSFATHLSSQEIEEVKEVAIDSVRAPIVKSANREANGIIKGEAFSQSFTRKGSSQKMDIHALGVAYKIKRLKQQLLVLEKLASMKQITVCDSTSSSPKDKMAEDSKQHLKGITLVIHLLSKQVKRFQSLEEKADDLCRRMNENNGGGNRKERSRVLENFLEETFQLQRYMVATGQKLIDIQSKITGSISSSDGLVESAGFNTEQFADVIRNLFREIQRGLEVRIARIIGDLEGTLACDGIRHM